MEEKAVESEKFRDIYTFYRLIKVKQHGKRYKSAEVENDKKDM